MTLAQVSTDPDLGPIRFCRACDEWWPFDGEFFRVVRMGKKGAPIYACLTCQRVSNRLCYERRQARRKVA